MQQSEHRPLLRVLVADDEPLAREVIRDLLAAQHDVEVVGESRTGDETRRAIDTLDPDLVFLDVQMPDGDGFDVLRSRAAGAGERPTIVFVTAYDQFAVRAFEANACDYLVKPFSDGRLLASLDRARCRITPRRVPHRPVPLTRVLASAGSAAISIDVNDIRWIEADDYYARLHVAQRRHLLRMSLSELDRRLDPARFVRVHRGAIVNLSFVSRLLRTADGRQVIVLDDGQRIAVSERRRAHVAERLGRVRSAR